MKDDDLKAYTLKYTDIKISDNPECSHNEHKLITDIDYEIVNDPDITMLNGFVKIDPKKYNNKIEKPFDPLNPKAYQDDINFPKCYVPDGWSNKKLVIPVRYVDTSKLSFPECAELYAANSIIALEKFRKQERDKKELDLTVSKSLGFDSMEELEEKFEKDTLKSWKENASNKEKKEEIIIRYIQIGFGVFLSVIALSTILFIII